MAFYVVPLVCLRICTSIYGLARSLSLSLFSLPIIPIWAPPSYSSPLVVTSRSRRRRRLAGSVGRWW